MTLYFQNITEQSFKNCEIKICYIIFGAKLSGMCYYFILFDKILIIKIEITIITTQNLQFVKRLTFLSINNSQFDKKNHYI